MIDNKKILPFLRGKYVHCTLIIFSFEHDFDYAFSFRFRSAANLHNLLWLFALPVLSTAARAKIFGHQ